MPEFIPDVSSFLRFKKMQIIQNANTSSSVKNKINKNREYDADERILNIPRNPFSYQKGADLLSFLVPQEQRLSEPTINFSNSYGQYSRGGIQAFYISKVYAEWLPVSNASYYKVFICIGKKGTSSSRTDAIPLGSTGGPLFVYDSGPITTTSFTLNIADGHYDTERIAAFIFSYTSTGIRSLFPLYCLRYSLASTRTLFLDKTTYTLDRLDYFYFLDNTPDTSFADQINQKPLLLV